MEKEYQESSFAEDLPEKSLTVDEYHLHEFFRTMCERQSIYLKRNSNAQDPPWTDDVILRDNRFTNVYRELDRNSQWEIKNILMDHTISKKDLVWKIIVFRLFNKIELFDFMGGIPNYDKFDQDEFLQVVSEFRKTGQNPFTGSYYVNNTFGKGLSRDESFCNITLPTVHRKIGEIISILMRGTPKDLHKKLLTIPGVGSFIAHEFYVSFTYAERYWKMPINSWTENTWTNVGPGAELGIRLIFPNVTKKNELVDSIRRIRDIAPDYLSKHFPEFRFLNWNKGNATRYYTKGNCNLTLHQVEMWLCEYSKYWKMSIGKGKQRSRFSPRNS